MSRYVASDWHGQYTLMEQIFNFLKEDDELFFLGDAIDRGPFGLQIMTKLLKDKRVTYIKGNHEDIFTICVPEFIEGHMENAGWWLGSNGGKDTWHSMEFMSDDSKLWYVNKLNRLPKRIDIVNTKGQNIILTHAGTDPDLTERDLQLMGRGADPYIWDRKHIHGNPAIFDQEEYKNTYIIHGHTPVPSGHIPGYGSLPQRLEEIPVAFYANNHKIDIDLGSFVTGRAALLDLDTFEVFYFEEEIVE